MCTPDLLHKHNRRPTLVCFRTFTVSPFKLSPTPLLDFPYVRFVENARICNAHVRHVNSLLRCETSHYCFYILLDFSIIKAMFLVFDRLVWDCKVFCYIYLNGKKDLSWFFFYNCGLSVEWICVRFK